VRVKSASLKNKSKIIITEKYKYFLFFSNEISFHGCNTRFYHGKNKHGSIHRRWVKSSVPWMDRVTDTLPPATRCNTLRTIGSLSLHRHDSQATTTSAWLVCTRYAHCPPISRSHQPAVLFSHNKPVTSNQSAVLFSQNKPAPAISHQPTEQAIDRSLHHHLLLSR
jgi:hypothetical protein